MKKNMADQPPPPLMFPPRKKGLVARLINGNQWFFRNKNDFLYGSLLTLSDDEQGVYNHRNETQGI